MTIWFSVRRLWAVVLIGLIITGCVHPMLPTSDWMDEHAINLFNPREDGELSQRETAEACLATATELDNAGHVREAVLLYEKARQNDPSTKVAARLAVLYDRAGEPAKAQAEFQRAIEQKPQDPTLLNDYGYFHLQGGDLSEAERWLKQAIELKPDHPRAISNLATVLAQQGRYDESVAMFSKVVRPAAAHSNVGVLLAREGKVDEAISHFNRALSLEPDVPQAKAFLAHLQIRPKDAGEAVAGS